MSLRRPSTSIGIFIFLLFLSAGEAFTNVKDSEFRTIPALNSVRPHSQPARIILKAQDPSGRPVAGARFRISLMAPSGGWFFSTDFPLIERTPLIEMDLLAPEGEVQWGYSFPIRGIYRLQVGFADRAGNKINKEIKMIDLYTWATPNGKKISIILEEVGLPYEVHPINFKKKEQFAPEFTAISPNNKIPAIVDRDGPQGKPYSMFESGAILMYLAEKTGKLMPKETRKYYDVLQWLMFQMGGVGPMFGQAHVFMHSTPEKIPFAIERYHQEARRLYGVMDRRLANCNFLAGDYSIADIATYTWVARHERHAVPLEDFPNVKRWFDTIGARPAVQRGMEVPKI